MKRAQQFRKIEWALRKSRHKEQKRYQTLRTLYKKVVCLSTSIWLKKFLGEGDKKPDAEEDNHSTVELIEIPGEKNTSKNYYDKNGYIYTNYKSKEKTSYLRCKNFVGKKCTCRAIVRNNDFGFTKLVTKHNHRPDKKAVDRLKFSRTLEKICIDNPFMKPLLCYLNAKKKLKNQIDIKNIPMPSSYSTFIHRKQKQIVPIMPKSIAEFENLIATAKNTRLYAYDDAGNMFYRGVWQGRTGENVAFVSESTLKEVENNPTGVTLLMDGTFKSVPRHLKFRQLYIINVIIKNRCYPLAYILMEKKDYHSYMTVFNEIKQMIPTMNVVNCMTDYECATRNAIQKQFPKARLSGCFFHYVQSIRKAAKRFGLRNKVDGEKFKRAINKVSALALLPNNFVTEGFELISESVENSMRWERFCTYWRQQWRKANISVFGLKDRTNNYSETLNHLINSLIGKKNPNIWFLIENLQAVEKLKSDELLQVADGLMIDKKISRETERLNKKIDRAVKRFLKTKDVATFLDNVTFNDDLADFFVHDFEEADIIDEFDEEVIPNSYNKKSDFRLKHPRAAAKKSKRL